MNLFNVAYAIFAIGFCASLIAFVLRLRERASRRGREPKAVLSVPGAPSIDILGEDQLRRALERLDGVEDGGSVRLSESESHYIEAVRRGQLWSTVLHTGRFWSSECFMAEGTSHYSEWEVRRRRAAGWKGAFLKRTRPDQALSTDQVRTLFIAYLLGSRYPLGGGGAG